MKSQIRNLLTLAAAAFLAVASFAQFSGNFTITDATYTPGYYNLNPGNTSIGNWTSQTIFAGSVDTTNFASGSIVFSTYALNAVPSASQYISMVAPTDLTISFTLNGSGQSFSGASEHAQFDYWNDGIYTSMHSVDIVKNANLTTGPTFVSFNVLAGHSFGFGVDVDNGIGGGVASMTETVSGFSAVSAVPEPSTYAAIFGLGALGVVIVRNRSRARLRAHFLPVPQQPHLD